MATKIPDLQTLIDAAKQKYVEEFGKEPDVVAYAPGRVNLIGEHTDYNDGFVLPMVINNFFFIINNKFIN